MTKGKQKKSAKELFYENKDTFCYFAEISEDIVRYASEMVHNFKKNYLIPKQDRSALKRMDYTNTLEYLTSANCNDLSFDYKVLILILVVDPDLMIYKMFCETSFISKKQIESENNIYVRPILTRKRIEQITDVQTRITELLGFFDKQLLYYELFYMNKIVCRHRINTMVLRNPYPDFLRDSLEAQSIEGVSNTRFNEIEALAKKFVEQIDTPATIAIVCNAIIYQNEQLQLQTTREKFIFFLLTLDSDFSLLTIYEEESHVEEIKKRALQELKFYDENLVVLERLLLRRFYPEKLKNVTSFSYANKKEKK